MAPAPIDPMDNDREDLPPEWVEAASIVARNLGLSAPLHELSAEHWQLVLVNVDARMRMRGKPHPFGWRRTLAEQVGRSYD